MKRKQMETNEIENGFSTRKICVLIPRHILMVCIETWMAECGVNVCVCMHDCCVHTISLVYLRIYDYAMDFYFCIMVVVSASRSMLATWIIMIWTNDDVFFFILVFFSSAVGVVVAICSVPKEFYRVLISFLPFCFAFTSHSIHIQYSIDCPHSIRSECG